MRMVRKVLPMYKIGNIILYLDLHAAPCMWYYSLHLSCSLLHAAPSGPPTNFRVRADSSRSLILSWDPPLPHYQNGIVRMYTVTVALNNSVQLTNISTTANSVMITAVIRPFRTYKCSVVAETVAVGPATENVIVTPEDSKCFLDRIHV